MFLLVLNSSLIQIIHEPTNIQTNSSPCVKILISPFFTKTVTFQQYLWNTCLKMKRFFETKLVKNWSRAPKGSCSHSKLKLEILNNLVHFITNQIIFVKRQKNLGWQNLLDIPLNVKTFLSEIFMPKFLRKCYKLSMLSLICFYKSLLE